MSESGEEKTPSAIMLFGKTISLLSSSVQASHQQEKLEQSEVLATDDHHHLQSYFGDHYMDGCDHNTETSLRGDGSSRKVDEQEEEREAIDKNHSGKNFNENSIDLATSSKISDNPKTPSVEREASSLKMAKDGEAEQTDHRTSSSSQEKPLKKPDKILPCPRCNSTDTKFCYYNNYNVNQPRHFCRSCQRYWTAGGTMRNVPVGAGRRKNKYSASASASSHYRQIMIPFAGNNIRHLTFGSDSPLSDTTASAISWDDRSSGSPVTDNRGKVNSAPGLTYPWNSPTPPPALSSSGFPIQLPPATSNWACNVPGQYWNSMNLSPTFLGKHSRDGYIISPSTTPGSNDDSARSRECGIFQGFQWKGGDDRNYYVADTSATVLEANPAAYSRSVNFRESAKLTWPNQPKS